MPTLANAQAVFLLRQFTRGLPDELIEAAKLDGASERHIYSRIILPLTTPVLATLGVFIFLSHWSDFFWPLFVAQSDSMRTFTVGLATLQQQQPTTGLSWRPRRSTSFPVSSSFWCCSATSCRALA